MGRIADRFVRYRELLDDFEAFAACLEERLPAHVRHHPDRLGSDEARMLLEEIGAEPTPSPWLASGWRVKRGPEIGRSWLWSSGVFHHQEEVSCLPVPLLDPQPGESVLDLCAAPGGKTAQIAHAVGRSGLVIANEPRMARHRALRQAIERLGLVNVACLRSDGTKLPSSIGTFDRVLADVPCSCEGTTRKSAHATERPERLPREEMAILQWRLLLAAVDRCRPGGRIVYSTCTYAPEENEGVVDEVLRRAEGAVRLVPAVIPGLVTRPGITAWEGRQFDPGLKHAARVWPHDNDSGGFFVAVLEKDGDAPATIARETLPPAHEHPLLEELFVQALGIASADLDDLAMTQSGSKGLYVGARDMGALDEPLIETRGIRFVRTKKTPPKPTTPAALELGRFATRAVVNLDLEQTETYRRHGTVVPRAEQLERVVEPGYVIVTHRGHPLGTGIQHARSGELESLFPKALAPKDPR